MQLEKYEELIKSVLAVVGEVGGVNKSVLVPKRVVGEVGGVNKSVLVPGGANKKEGVQGHLWGEILLAATIAQWQWWPPIGFHPIVALYSLIC